MLSRLAAALLGGLVLACVLLTAWLVREALVDHTLRRRYQALQVEARDLSVRLARQRDEHRSEQRRLAAELERLRLRAHEARISYVTVIESVETAAPDTCRPALETLHRACDASLEGLQAVAEAESTRAVQLGRQVFYWRDTVTTQLEGQRDSALAFTREALRPRWRTPLVAAGVVVVVLLLVTRG